MSTKRKSYIVKQKLEIISKAKEMSNKAAAQIFGIDHFQVSSSEKKAVYPLAEETLNKWIVQLQQDSLAVILSTIKLKIKELFRTRFQQDYPNALETFKASNSWQKLPHELSKQLDQFYEFIKKLQHINNYKLSCIANMDEMSIYFDIVGNLTVDYYSAKTVQIRTTDNEKTSLRVFLQSWLMELNSSYGNFQRQKTFL
ncbi:25664_t:CDS:2, partial [Racocetra persica]